MSALYNCLLTIVNIFIKFERSVYVSTEDMKNETAEQETESTEQINENDNNTAADDDISAKYKAQIQKLTEELANQKDIYLRVAAEYDNFRKRTKEEKLGIYADATANAVKGLLPIADSVTMALMSMKDVAEEYKKGVELISNQLKDCFKKLNVEEFGEVNEKFDPNIHNAIAHIESEDFEENVISQVFQKGYKLNDKVIRHAMVQVAN